MANTLIGKLYEKRRDDVFEVVVAPSGEVVGVTQFYAEFGAWSKALVRRRKAGPVEVVDV